MILLSISSLSRLQVKWANIHKGNEMFHNVWHSNPYYQLIMVTDGPIYLEVEDEKLTIKSGECLILTPWQKHQGWKPIGDQDGFFWVQFTVDPKPEVLDSKQTPAQEIKFIQADSNDLRTAGSNEMQVLVSNRIQTERRFEISILLERLVREMKTPIGYYHMRMSILLGSVIEILATDLIQQSHLDPELPVAFILYRKIVNALEETFNTDFSSDNLEHSLNRKYEYICAVFKKYSGTTITSYIQQLRLQRAKHLLEFSEKSISDIAYEVGFKDPFYFTRLFKKIIGISPLQFRNQTWE